MLKIPSFLSKVPTSLFFIFPLLSLAGLHVTDAARGMACVGALAWIVMKRRHQGLEAISLPSAPYTIFLLIAALTLLLASSCARVFLGQHGLDQLIFSQAAASFAYFGRFWVTYNRGWLNDFLQDHFSPLLAVPAAMIKLGIPDYFAVIISQALTVALAVWIFYRFARRLGAEPATAAIVPLLWIFLGDVRSQIYWGVQAEYLALPFVVLAYERRAASRPWHAVGSALLAFGAKETLMAWGVAFALYAIIRDRKVHFAYVFLMLMGAFGFFAYTLGHSWFFEDTYVYNGRIVLWDAWNTPTMAMQRLLYGMHFFLPVLFFPLLKRKRWYFVLPALPWIGMAMISNFPDMYSMNRQYVVLPMTVVWIAALEAYASEKKDKGWGVSWPVALLLVGLCFSWGEQKPMRSLIEFARVESYLKKADLPPIPANGRVFASSAAGLFLLDRKEQYPLSSLKEGMKADDRILLAKWEKEDILATPLSPQVKPCGAQGAWVLFCASAP